MKRTFFVSKGLVMYAFIPASSHAFLDSGVASAVSATRGTGFLSFISAMYLLAVSDDLDLMPRPLQKLRDDHLVNRVVLGDEDLQGAGYRCAGPCGHGDGRVPVLVVRENVMHGTYEIPQRLGRLHHGPVPVLRGLLAGCAGGTVADQHQTHVLQGAHTP